MKQILITTFAKQILIISIMNENLNLVEILKDCPIGTKLYSLIYGDVELEEVNDDEKYPIFFKLNNNILGKNIIEWVTKDGRECWYYDGECTLFPSKEQRDWGKFKPKTQPKFDPKTLQPFDKVLVRDRIVELWYCNFFSHRFFDKYAQIDGWVYHYCIPYNEDTKHLVGTTKDAPEFYRYWED